MTKLYYEQLEKELSVLGKNAVLSLTQRQKIRDRLFKQMGQLDLIDSMQTKTESIDLVMPVNKLQNIFRPRRIMLSLPATVGLIATVFLATFATGAIARDAVPGEPLFGVRKAFEAVQVMLTRDPVQRAAIQISIADERLENLVGVSPEQLEVVLDESQRAIISAQTAVAALQDADEATSAGLLDKLKELVINQRDIISTIIKENIANDEIKEAVIAVRDELDEILPEDLRKPAGEEVGIIIESNIFHGYVVTAYGQPALNTGEKIYLLVGVGMDLMQYIGADGVRIMGNLVENPTDLMGWGIQVREITINSKLIFDNQDYIVNDLPRVEDSQN